MRKILLALALLLSPVAAFGQGSVLGQETVVTYTGTNAQLTQANTPASAFQSPNGTNTFILSIPPQSAIRLFITNNSATPCPAGFTVQMFAASDAQVNSFNNQLSNWQTVPLQNVDGTLIQFATPSIPANGAVYITSTAITSPRVTIQVVNTLAGGCAGSLLEVFAVVTSVSVTSPLISSNSPAGFNQGGVANQVQGIASPGTNGSLVNPVVAGSLGIPVNQSFFNFGIDNLNTSGGFTLANSFTGNINIGQSPKASKQNSFAVLAIASHSSGSSTILGPWNCSPNGIGTTTTGAGTQNVGCNANIGGIQGLVTLAGVYNPASAVYNFTGSSQPEGGASVGMVFSSALTARQSTFGSSNVRALAATLSGSLIIAAITCNGSVFPCVSGLTDTQGNTWKQVGSVAITGGVPVPGMYAFITQTGATTAPTVTAAVIGGSTCCANFELVEFTGQLAAPLNFPNLAQQADALGNEVVRLDSSGPPNEFTCSVTISTATTTQLAGCAAPTTINNIPVRIYVTDVQYNTTTAGAASTLQLVTGTGANCGTGTGNLTTILYSGAAVGLQNLTGLRTPFIAPLQSAVCVTQVGATPSTTTVEVHAFLSP